MLVAASMVGAACNSESSSTGTADSTTIEPSTTEPTTTMPEPTAAPATPAPATDPPATAAPPTDPPAPTADCSAAAMLPLLTSLFPSNPAWVIVDVDIANCQNGYARVFAVPDMSSCPDPTMPCLESEQLFLGDVSGTWKLIDYGTGLDCGDPASLLPATQAACVALGLA